MGNKKIIGLILVLIGLINFASRQGWISGEYFLIGLGSVFLIAYFIRQRPIGFLIPACILILLGTYANLQSSRLLFMNGRIEGAAFFFFMAIAFYLIFFIHNTKNGSLDRKTVWPAIVGIALTVFGIFVYAVEYWDITELLIGINRFWPLILILIGLYLILTKKKKD
ncbi:MAG: hypothetical protein JJE29_05595 [Peptostreptococcaceae bacterium]|nr:hypothetical protein [Peptostreptococcaceae bacterium]